MTRPRVVLVGAPGAGKSTVGTGVAAALGVTFRDTDHDVEDRSGKTVADVFVEDGEEAFRALEREAVAAALGEHDGVLALGGGAVLDPATRALLRSTGAPVVHLQVGLTVAVKRVGLARDRPVLVVNPRAQLHRLLQERLPLYAEVATASVGTDDREVDEVVADVLRVLEAAR